MDNKFYSYFCFCFFEQYKVLACVCGGVGVCGCARLDGSVGVCVCRCSHTHLSTHPSTHPSTKSPIHPPTQSPIHAFNHQTTHPSYLPQSTNPHIHTSAQQGTSIFDFLLFFNLVHPDSAGESNPTTYLEKAIFDILSNSERGRIF